MDIIKRVYIEMRARGFDVTQDDIRLLHKEFCSSGSRDFMEYAQAKLLKWSR